MAGCPFDEQIRIGAGPQTLHVAEHPRSAKPE